MKEGGSCEHRLEPLQRVMVCINFECHRHQVGVEFGNSPDDGEALQFCGGVGFLRLVDGARGTANNALLAFPDLCEDCAEACGEGVGIQPERQAEVREGGDGAGGEGGLEVVEGVLALWTPMEDRIFPGESVERAGNSSEIFDITPVVPGEAQE